MVKNENDLRNIIPKTKKPNNYPYPARLSAQQAKIGLSQLIRLKSNLQHRKEIATMLEKEIGWNGFSEKELKHIDQISLINNSLKKQTEPTHGRRNERHQKHYEQN